MDPTRGDLEKIMESLTPGEWLNPHIFSWNEEYRIVHTLVATSPQDGQMYYYEPDSGKFERLNLPA